MITCNSLSGGQTSSYIAANYQADYNVFSLVRTDDVSCKFPDEIIRKRVSDKLGLDFIGTLEDDVIIYTMFDLEQFIGKKIDWVTGETFDSIIDRGNGKKYLPNVTQRFCTSLMKLKPIFEWWYRHFSEPIEMRLGYRANEQRRAVKMQEKAVNGFQTYKHIVGVKEIVRSDGKIGYQNKHKVFEWQKAVFPLINDGVFRDNIVEYWRDKPVRFAYMNNCIGCFHRNEPLLNLMSKMYSEKYDWFVKQEQNVYKKTTFKNGITYKQIRDYNFTGLLFDDFSECDSGFCEI